MVSKEIRLRLSQSAHSYISLSFSLLKKQSIFVHILLDDEDIEDKTLLWVKEKEPRWFFQRDPDTVWP